MIQMTGQRFDRLVVVEQAGHQGGMYEPWNDYQTFLIYLRNTIGPHPGAGWSLDRRNNDHGYFPGNIRWATAKTQANNRSKREAIA